MAINATPGHVRAGDLSGDFNRRVRVRNADALKANLGRLLKSAKKAVRLSVSEAADRITARTIDLCPKDTFYMSEHVRTTFSKAGFTFTVGWDALDFIGTTDDKGQLRSFYPFFVEFGTRHMRAQPSLSIAYVEERPRYQAALAAAMKNAYARTAR